MKFFFSCEAYAPASGYIMALAREVTEKLSILSDKSYGDELVDIGIISICMPEYFYEDGAFPERRLFQRKLQSVDIRLKIDYKVFKRGPKERRKEMYKEHVIQSIETLRNKVSKQYDFDGLIQDVKRILEQ